MRTIFPKEIDGLVDFRTVSAQILAETEGRKMRFPKTIKHRRFEATIYGKSKNYNYYRIAYYITGKRRIRNFKTFSEAKSEAERIVRDLAKGSQSAALSADQSRDAITAFEMLEAFRQASGRRISLPVAISEFVEASKKLGARTLHEAADGFLKAVVTITRKKVSEAVKEFSQAAETRTKTNEGQRAQLSAKYAYNRQLQLQKFSDAFPGTAVCDLTKGHLDGFIESLRELKTKSRNRRKAISAKSRNHYRAAVRQFLNWAVRKDYLPGTHRLFDADGLRPEHANNSEVAFYAPADLAALLANSDDTLRPLIAIGGLAGLRTAELLRLDWSDVWRTEKHIEITAKKSKTRQRRLVEILPALARWLEPFRAKKDGKLWTGHEVTFQQAFVALCERAKVSRIHNGLRHAFCTYHCRSGRQTAHGGRIGICQRAFRVWTRRQHSFGSASQRLGFWRHPNTHQKQSRPHDRRAYFCHRPQNGNGIEKEAGRQCHFQWLHKSFPSYITVHRLVKRGLLKNSKSLRSIIIPAVEIERFLKETL